MIKLTLAVYLAVCLGVGAVWFFLQETVFATTEGGREGSKFLLYGIKRSRAGVSQGGVGGRTSEKDSEEEKEEERRG